MNELMEQYAPNYMALINGDPGINKDVMLDSGNIKGFSMIEGIVQGPYTGLTIRQDWLDDLGLATPVTFDDWHTVLTAFKDQKGATAPLLLKKELFYAGDHALMAGYDVSESFYQVNGTVKYGPLEQGFKDYLVMMKQWYDEGLIDRDFTTRDSDSANQLLYTSQAGARFGGFWELQFNDNHAEDPNYREVAVATPVKNKGDVAHLRQSNRNYREYDTFVSATSKYPVEAVRWLDNLYSEDNYLTVIPDD
jgi:putative aldouronate transport system substrate-binding protein